MNCFGGARAGLAPGTASAIRQGRGALCCLGRALWTYLESLHRLVPCTAAACGSP